MSTSLQRSEAHGTVFLCAHYLLLKWWVTLRTKHPWISAFTAPTDASLRITRSQRLAVLAATTLTGLAFNALFFGAKPETTEQSILYGLLSVLVMAPTHQLLPRVFMAANTFDSSTTFEARRNAARKRIRQRQFANAVLAKLAQSRTQPKEKAKEKPKQATTRQSLRAPKARVRHYLWVKT